MTRRASSRHLENLLSAAHQGLLDLSATGASDVVFVREHRAPPSSFFDPLEEQALELGFVVATAPLPAEAGFDSLAAIVKGFALHLRSAKCDDKGPSRWECASWRISPPGDRSAPRVCGAA